MATLITSVRRLFIILPLALLLSAAQAAPAHWAAEIDQLTQGDTANPPPLHGIVFVGSSSIRFWETLAQDFPALPVIRRGFGGSELADSVYYADRIIIPYQPKTVVLYAGDNDIAAGVSPEKVAADFQAFCAKIHRALPKTRILYLAMKPSPRRWDKHQEMERGNALIAAACARDPRLGFVDIYTAMLGADGQPRPELYRDDKLHMKPAGYAIWIHLLEPLLKS